MQIGSDQKAQYLADRVADSRIERHLMRQRGAGYVEMRAELDYTISLNSIEAYERLLQTLDSLSHSLRPRQLFLSNQ
jgi:hypothetical protein